MCIAAIFPLHTKQEPADDTILMRKVEDIILADRYIHTIIHETGLRYGSVIHN